MMVERAIKVTQKTVDCLRRRNRGIAAAQAFFCKGQFWVGRRR
jgi:transposase-like protein